MSFWDRCASALPVGHPIVPMHEVGSAAAADVVGHAAPFTIPMQGMDRPWLNGSKLISWYDESNALLLSAHRQRMAHS